MTIFLDISLSAQTLTLLENHTPIKKYFISSGKNGAGEERDSGKTPRGLHIVRAKIGKDMPANTVFRGRRPTGEIFTPALRTQFPERDWILTRILWLSGLEVGKNRLGDVDTMQRYIYIHGTPDDVEMGVPGSKGCIRMRNAELVELYEKVSHGTRITIHE